MNDVKMGRSHVRALRELPKYFGVSRAAVFNLRKNDPDFPKAIQLGPRNLVFKVSELDEYLEKKKEG